MNETQTACQIPTSLRRAARLAGALLIVWIAATLASAQQAPTLDVTGYNIDATLNPATHMLTATTSVTFTPLQAVPVVEFQLHGALKVDKLTDASGAALNGQRGPNETILVTPTSPLTVGQSYTWTFHYAGALEGSGGPVPGLKLAYVGSPISYLLYGGAWFPMAGYQTDRYTADITVHVPAGYTVIGSGATSAAPAEHNQIQPLHKKKGSAAAPKGCGPQNPCGVIGIDKEYDFKWDKPGFPGTIIAGKFEETSPAPNIHLFTTAANQQYAHDYGHSALDIWAYFTSTFGMPESMRINVVELPNDTVRAY